MLKFTLLRVDVSVIVLSHLAQKGALNCLSLLNKQSGTLAPAPKKEARSVAPYIAFYYPSLEFSIHKLYQFNT